MRQKYILTLIVFGGFLSGMTWAGPPETEVPPDETTVNEPETPTYGSGTDPEMAEETTEKTKDYLTFEEAVAVCSDREDMQSCIDTETGQTEQIDKVMEDVPMDSETVEPELELETDEEAVPE